MRHIRNVKKKVFIYTYIHTPVFQDGCLDNFRHTLSGDAASFPAQTSLSAMSRGEKRKPSRPRHVNTHTPNPDESARVAGRVQHARAAGRRNETLEDAQGVICPLPDPGAAARKRRKRPTTDRGERTRSKRRGRGADPEIDGEINRNRAALTRRSRRRSSPAAAPSLSTVAVYRHSYRFRRDEAPANKRPSIAGSGLIASAGWAAGAYGPEARTLSEPF